MSVQRVNIVTAFGRGESLALALQNEGFSVGVYDLTEAFPFEYRRGAGPFPFVKQPPLQTHTEIFDQTQPLNRGLVLWLKDGPIEFSGPMARFYVEHHEAFRNAVQRTVGENFDTDWIRRFLRQWTSPYHMEPWMTDRGPSFPVDRPLGLIPRARERDAISFERLQGRPIDYIRCTQLKDVQIQSSRLIEVEVGTGSVTAVTGDQWIWCLSSLETLSLSEQVAEALFNRDIRRPEWLWISMHGDVERGPWVDGFPRYSVVINDVYLPWTHANAVMLEWIDKDKFEIWMKVPAETTRDPNQRLGWAQEVERLLTSKLALGRWKIDANAFSICPHSFVFSYAQREWAEPGWKNWDWIAPETAGRLDFTARFEREEQALRRITQWRIDQLKKQGGRKNDQAVHAP